MTGANIVALVVLPEHYNPDRKGHKRRIEIANFEQSMAEISFRFGGGFLWRFGSQAPRGFWWDHGILYEDEVTVIEVDIPNDEDAKRWLIDYARKTLAERFKQKAIYIRFIGPIEVEVVTID